MEASGGGGGGGGGTNDYNDLLHRPIVDVDGVSVVVSDKMMMHNGGQLQMGEAEGAGVVVSTDADGTGHVVVNGKELAECTYHGPTNMMTTTTPDSSRVWRLDFGDSTETVVGLQLHHGTEASDDLFGLFHDTKQKDLLLCTGNYNNDDVIRFTTRQGWSSMSFGSDHRVELSERGLVINCDESTFTDSGMVCAHLGLGSRGSRIDEYAAATNCGAVLVGGATQTINLSSISEAGVVLVGGESNSVTTSDVRQACMIVGGHNVTRTITGADHAILHVGSENGFDMSWDGQQSTLKMNGKTVNVQYSQTVTHEAPFTGDASDYAIGDPVFASIHGRRE